MKGSSPRFVSRRKRASSVRLSWSAISGLGFALVVIFSGAGPASIAGAADDPTATEPIPTWDSITKLMPTGDSITEGNGSTNGLGFRQLLYDSLNALGSFDFVGSPDSPGGDPPYEGHFYGGQRINAFRPGGAHDVAAPMNAQNPDMVAVHLGTNDINSTPGPYGPWSLNHGVTTTSNPSGRLGSLVKYLLDWRNGTNGTFLEQVVLSRIVPIVGRDLDMETYNREVVRMVLDFRNGAVTGSPEPVYLADHYIQFLSNPDFDTEWMDDFLHPNDAGYDQMESVYTTAVVEALGDMIPPATPTDLAVGTQNGESVLLLWTNTGDDGISGNPSYADCRYATGSINAGNFKNQTQGGDYNLVGNGGEIGGQRIPGLGVSTNYNFAIKLMDDASRLSGMSNVVTAPTLADADTWKDAFNRNMAALGMDWNAGPEYIVNGTELENAGTMNSLDLAVFRLVEGVQTCQFNWGTTASQAGIDNGGFAVRLDTSDPNTADGYIVYRNVEIGGPLVLKEIIDGEIEPPTLDAVFTSLPAPQAGDEFRVDLSTDPAGHHFSVFINDQLDGVLDDPQKLHGNDIYYCGVITQGDLDNNIDNWQVGTTSTNLPPAAFALVAPPDGSILPNLNPILDWQDSLDPNGDPVTYTLYYSLDPGFDPEQTTEVPALTESFFAIGTPLLPNQTYYWEVKAQDPHGAFTFSSDTWSFDTVDFQQVLDNFERANLGPDWVADPTYSIENGELECVGLEFEDIAIFQPVENPVSVEWKWSETAVQSEIGYAGCLIGVDSASTTAADGYFVFRNTTNQMRWSCWEMENGELTGSLNIGQDGRLPIPGPGDVMRVVFVKTPTAHYFECYINGVYDARMTDSQRRQGTAPITYAGLLLGEGENNVEEFVVTAEGANLPPAAFNLIEPTDGEQLYSLVPEMQWEPATDPNPGDVVNYSVIYSLDSSFANADTLPPTTATLIHFTGKLTSGEPYYWKVRAQDSGGGAVLSNQSWSFSLAPTAIFADDFNRANLGPGWSGDLAEMQIVANELANTSPTASFDVAVYNALSNADAIELTWSPTANTEGIRRGGLALMLDSPSASPNGYFASIDPATNQASLEEIRNGSGGFAVASGSGQIAPPGPGDRFKVILATDAAGHHFFFFVNRVFHSRLDDPNKLQGNGLERFAGVALLGLYENRVNDFRMEAFTFGTGVPTSPAPGLPLALALHQNLPNPFNPSTVIPFDLPDRAAVRLVIFDVGGRVVRELTSEVLEPGRHAATWNGRDTNGAPMGSGVYFARLAVGDWSGTRKLLLVK